MDKFHYSTEELDAHFQDIVLPSRGSAQGQRRSLSSAQGTFNIWTAISDKCDGNATDENIFPPISRMTIFSRAQPLFPPFIYTRSDPKILGENVGRVFPVFPQIPRSRNLYIFDRYVKIVAVDTVQARSDELKSFICKKIKSGGMSRERTKEQWEGTFEVDWHRVSLIPFDMEREINPMHVNDLAGFVEGLQPQ
jgi:hypothetical protein